MFSLMSGIVKWFFTKPALRILVLGIDNAGKTTTLEWIKSSQGQKTLTADQIVPTVGLNLARVDTSGSVVYFWDLGGQKSLRTLWNRFYEECHAVLYVIDISDTPDRLDETIQVLKQILSSLDHLEKPLPVVLLLNKVDLVVDRDDQSPFGRSSEFLLKKIQTIQTSLTPSDNTSSPHQSYIAGILLGSAIQMNSTHGRSLISLLIRFAHSKSTVPQQPLVQTLWTDQPFTQRLTQPLTQPIKTDSSYLLLRAPPPFLPMLVPACRVHLDKNEHH